MGRVNAGSMKIGPNGTSGVVWALGEFFLFSFVFFFILSKRLTVSSGLNMKYTTGWTETTKTGPNDASGVVWAIGEFFLHCF